MATSSHYTTKHESRRKTFRLADGSETHWFRTLLMMSFSNEPDGREFCSQRSYRVYGRLVDSGRGGNQGPELIKPDPGTTLHQWVLPEMVHIISEEEMMYISPRFIL
jgi:hypothetical protein